MALLKFCFIFCLTISITNLLINALSVQNDVCGNGQVPLAGYFCGRGLNRRDCPSTHDCVIAPDDAYAVCCPRSQERAVRSTDKPGSCPPPSGMVGICIARCTTDEDCSGNDKCCGSCPRECTKAIF